MKMRNAAAAMVLAGLVLGMLAWMSDQPSEPSTCSAVLGLDLKSQVSQDQPLYVPALSAPRPARGTLSATGPLEPDAYAVYNLELINRGRADPNAEAARYGIDLNEGLDPGTISSDAKQPLAWNLYSNQSASNHNDWMLSTDIFSHYETTDGQGSSALSSDPNTTGKLPWDRMTAAGATYTSAGENLGWSGTTGTLNVQTTTESIHGNLFVDANYPGRGHRTNMMSESWRELGTNVKEGVFTSTYNYNALMVTENYSYYSSDYFITGVAYNDSLVTADSFYTPGEGLGSITVTAVRDSDSATYTTTTWSSGAYSLKVDNGTYTVTATGSGLGGTVTYTGVTVSSQNVKKDFTPADVVSPPTATLSATDSSAAEAGPDTGTFTVSLSAAATSDVTVSYSVGGTATSGNDYTALSGTVTVSSGQSSATITVTPVDDSTEESDETVVVTLSSGTGYTVGGSSADTVTIADNDAATTHTLSGTITRGGAAVASAWIDLFTSAGAWVKNTQTDTSGNYSFSGLADGSYNLTAYDPSQSNAASAYSGNPVSVSGSDVSGVDFAFATVYTVSGTVTQGGAAAAGVWLDLFTSGGTWKGNAQTDASGNYALGPVETGTYNIYAYEPGTGTKTAYGSNPVTVSSSVTGIDFAFSAKYSVSGTVTLGGTAKSGVWLDLFSSSGTWMDNAQTDGAGNFSLGPVEAGTYNVYAYEPGSMTQTAYSGNSVTVAADVTGVDFAFAGYTVSGTVTQGGAAASGVWLDIFDTAGKWHGNTQTDASGNYSLGPVVSSTYNIYAYEPDTGTKTSYGSNPVTVSGTTTGIDFSFVAKYAVTGTVTYGGAASSGTWLDLFTSGGTWVDNAQTDASGNYSLGPVEAGTYNVYAYEPGTMTKTAYGSNPVTVASAVSGVDFAFSAYSIRGTVTVDGAAASGLWLDLWSDTSGAWVANTQTDASGNYTLSGVPADRYNLYVYRFGTLTRNGYGSNPLTVSSDVTGADFALAGDGYEADDSAPGQDTLTLGTTQNRSIHTGGDEDWARFTLSASTAVELETGGTSGDTVMYLYGPDSSGTLIEMDDDDGTGTFSYISRTLAAGTYYVRITEYYGTGTISAYTLSLKNK